MITKVYRRVIQDIEFFNENNTEDKVMKCLEFPEVEHNNGTHFQHTTRKELNIHCNQDVMGYCMVSF